MQEAREPLEEDLEPNPEEVSRPEGLTDLKARTGPESLSGSKRTPERKKQKVTLGAPASGLVDERHLQDPIG